MKSSPLRHYPTFVKAVADFIIRHNLTVLPTLSVFRQLGAGMLAHFWRRCHQQAGHDLRADVEARLGHPLADAPARPPARRRYADYAFYLEQLRAYARAKGLTHVPSRKDLGHSSLGVFFGRHRDRHDLAADLGLPYRLDAERIPAAYLEGDANVGDLLTQFLALHGLSAVPHEQQLYLFKHGKKLSTLVGPLRAASGMTWAALVSRLGLALDPDAPRKRPEDYTSAEVIAEVRVLCARLGHFPSAEEFRHLGCEYLLARVRDRFGKASVLARHLGYPAARKSWVAQDGHRCASFGEVRTDDALARLGVAHRPQARLVPRRRYTADWGVRGPRGPIAVEALMVDPEQPRRGVPRCEQYLARFARKVEAYRHHGVALIVVVPARYPSDAALQEYLRGELSGHGVTFGEPGLLSLGPAAGGGQPGPEEGSAQRPPGYWTLLENVLAEVRAILEAHGLREVPPMGFFAKIGRYDVRAAIHQYWSRQALGTALGLPVASPRYQPVGYWRDLEHVAAAVREYVRGREPACGGFPTRGELGAKQQYRLANALRNLTEEQLDAVAARTGLVRKETTRKPSGYWQIRANVVRELAEFARQEQMSAFPTAGHLRRRGRFDLIGALKRFSPEELDALAVETGLTRRTRRPRPRR